MTRPWYRWLPENGVTIRAAVLVLGVLVLQLGFIASYLGAFHKPTPHEIAIAVTNPQAAPQLNALPGKPLHASVAADRAEAVRQIDNQDVYGGLVSGRSSDELLVVSAR